MQKFQNVEKIINKEINFLNGSEKLIEENYKEFIEFSSKFYNAEKRVKDKNLDKGVTKAINEELKMNNLNLNCLPVYFYQYYCFLQNLQKNI